VDIASLHCVALVYSFLCTVYHLGVLNVTVSYSYATLPCAKMGNLHRCKHNKQYVGGARGLVMQQVSVKVK
jgi:hypothetical protein